MQASATTAPGSFWRLYQETETAPFRTGIPFLCLKSRPSEPGDFDGDRRPELAVFTPYSYGGKVSVLAVQTDWSLQLRSTMYLDAHIRQFVETDFNGDGNPDLFAAEDWGTYEFWALLGAGDNTFQPTRTEFHPMVEAFAAGDLNHDGKADVVGGGRPEGGSSLVIWLGQGDGSFQSPTELDSPGNAWALALADYNGDGNRDEAKLSQSPQAVEVYLGNGDGTFQAPQTRVLGGPAAFDMSTADFNLDGRLDLALSGEGVMVMIGNGDGTFAHPGIAFSTLGSAIGGVADYDGDDKPDIFLIGGGSVSLLINTTPVASR